MSDEPDPLTQAQRDALIRAYEQLGEQFEHLVIAIHTSHATDDSRVVTKAYYKGGCVTAMGLCYEAIDHLRNAGTISEKDEDP